MNIFHIFVRISIESFWNGNSDNPYETFDPQKLVINTCIIFSQSVTINYKYTREIEIV